MCLYLCIYKHTFIHVKLCIQIYIHITCVHTCIYIHLHDIFIDVFIYPVHINTFTCTLLIHIHTNIPTSDPRPFDPNQSHAVAAEPSSVAAVAAASSSVAALPPSQLPPTPAPPRPAGFPSVESVYAGVPYSVSVTHAAPRIYYINSQYNMKLQLTFVTFKIRDLAAATTNTHLPTPTQPPVYTI